MTAHQIIRSYFKEKIEEGYDSDTVLQFNSDLCKLIPEQIHEDEIISQHQKIAELEKVIDYLCGRLEMQDSLYSDSPWKAEKWKRIAFTNVRYSYDRQSTIQ